MRKPRTRKDMVAYLSEHFRYHTMNSWNRSTSYATRIKICYLDLSKEQQDAVYAMLGVRDSWNESGYNHVLGEFDRRHNHYYQISTNGRSGGYLVMIQGGERPSEHKSSCRQCGQRNFQKVEVEPGKCGRCGAEARYNRQFPPDVYSNPGKSLDMDEDFNDKREWSLQALKNRVDLVWDFDQTCARAIKAYVEYAMENKVVEEEILVPTKILVAEPREAAE